MEAEEELQRAGEATRAASLRTKEGASMVTKFIKDLIKKIETLTKWPTQK